MGSKRRKKRNPWAPFLFKLYRASSRLPGRPQALCLAQLLSSVRAEAEASSASVCSTGCPALISRNRLAFLDLTAFLNLRLVAMEPQCVLDASAMATAEGRVENVVNHCAALDAQVLSLPGSPLHLVKIELSDLTWSSNRSLFFRRVETLRHF
ncbi:hypothetical protein B0H15DRAFT_38037 [Mycena belliarum]|uniref:Uncharacterized protein n=1 Tax=Mycena belliarum TaxID=1033014 RepID=A0AAD6TNY9_9AGAR|nr:hypothetical protein B0H15DRAFT_38037 [Mycena belliae]